MAKIVNVDRRLEALEDELLPGEDDTGLVEVHFYLAGYADFSAKYTPQAYAHLTADLTRIYGNDQGQA